MYSNTVVNSTQEPQKSLRTLHESPIHPEDGPYFDPVDPIHPLRRAAIHMTLLRRVPESGPYSRNLEIYGSPSPKTDIRRTLQKRQRMLPSNVQPQAPAVNREPPSYLVRAPSIQTWLIEVNHSTCECVKNLA